MRLRRHRPDTSALRLIGLDNTFTDRQLEALAAHTDVVRAPAGQVLARAGTVARQFVAVVDGDVAITDPDGGTRFAGSGWQGGAPELIARRPHATTVVTSSDSTLVVVFGPAFTSAALSRRSDRKRRAASTELRPGNVTAHFEPRVPAFVRLNPHFTKQRSA